MEIPLALNIFLCGLLVALSGLFSGLTLGLMGLDKVALQVVMESGAEKERKYAKRIYPVRERGNLLLCTLLLGNVAVNSLLAIFLADLTSGLIGFLLATVLIVTFGEIIPQAACSRHGLYIGAHTVWLVYFFMIILFPFTWPISKLLDKVLGDEIGTIFSKLELEKLVDIHARSAAADLSDGEAGILAGVLKFSEKAVHAIMIPLDNAIVVNIDDHFSEEILTMLWESGHSRIPVYEKRRSNIVGLILVKDLSLMNPEEHISVRTLLSFYGRPLTTVFPNCKLMDLFNEFKSGKTHLACVQDVNDEGPGDPFYEAVGIVTMEDLIEEILQTEIVDETDVFVDVASHEKVRRERSGAHINIFRRELKSERLSPDQVKAVEGYLIRHVPPFQDPIIRDLPQFITKCPVVKFEFDEEKEIYIYQRGIKANYAVLVLSGKVEVKSGEDEFPSTVGPWSVLAQRALRMDDFIPDFSAVTRRKVKALMFSKIEYDTFISLCNSASDERSNSMDWASYHSVVRQSIDLGTVPLLGHREMPDVVGDGVAQTRSDEFP